MRTSLVITVLIMGLLGIILAVATGEAYQRLALDNQRESFAALAKLKIHEIIEDLTQDSVDLGLSIQATTGFQQAFKSESPTQISNALDEHFNRVFVTLGRVKLLKIYALDAGFNLITSSNVGDPTLPTDTPVCTSLLNKVSTRSKALRLKPDSILCRNNTQPLLVSVIPIGGLRIQGYLQLVIDPTPGVARADIGLNTPLTLTTSDNVIQAQSSNWPEKIDKDTLLATYELDSDQSEHILTFTFASNIAELRDKLSSTRNLIIFIAAIVMLSAILLALFLLERTALIPLNTLTNHLRRVQDDKSQLGEAVTVNGNTEIVELASDFNNMSSELSTLYRTLENMAFTDSLTGLANRALFYDRLEQAALTASRYDTPFTLLVMDLDRFKSINDNLGHHIGDQLLQQTAQRLQTVLRKSDTLARLGSDEFAALLPALSSKEGINFVAKKIQQVVNENFSVDGNTLSIGISIGIVCSPNDGDNATLLMQHADVAMHHAKQQGVDFCFYDESMNNENIFGFTMESELRKAMENKDFELYYQPKIDIQKKQITGVEALIRWTHEEHGFIPPDKFIPLAEKTGHIQKLTEWVLQTALAQCAEWKSKGIDINVSVNLSAYSLNDIDLLDTVRHALAKAELDPKWLTLELTETAIMSDPDRALSTLSRLNSMGIALSIDDFGTGYSSLAYLKRFPVNEIKIDKSFVMEMTEDAFDAVIVRSTIDLAHNMGMTVIAEGIETQEAWDRLQEFGCNLGQGYLMCRPCPPKELEQWLDESDWSGRKK